MAKKIVLVDGSSYLFRAYHALPPLTNSQGMATGAMYGVIKMLKSLYDDYHPDFFAIVFDAKGKTFRHDMYDQYKANRNAMPSDLAEQIEPLHRIIKALGWPLLIYPGVEADDVLGALSKHATKAGLKTIISTGDKDLAQLVDEKVSLINTMNFAVSDIQGVIEKFGVRPDQIIDFLSLTGDTSDNIPGVNKVGAKTAAKWLNEYDNLDNIIENSDKFKGKIGEYLREAISSGMLDLSKRLVTIDCNIQLEHDVTELTVSDPDNELLKNYFSTFGFKSWLAEINAADDPTANTDNYSFDDYVEPITINYQTILTEQALNDWIAKMLVAPIVSIDTETTSLNIIDAKLVGLSFCIEPGSAVYLPLAHDNCDDELVTQQLDFASAMEKLRPILASHDIKKVGQNLKYDRSVLAQAGFELNGISDDTMLQSYVLNSTASKHDMNTLAKKHLEISPVTFEDIAGKGKKQLTFNQIDIESATNYAAEDADITLRLYLKFESQLSDKSVKIYKDIEMPLLEILSDIEQNGVLVDSDKLSEISDDLGNQMQVLEQKAYELAGDSFNMSSPKQIQQILYEKLDLPVLKKTPKGQPSTAEEVLKQLSEDYELPGILIEHRGLSKLKSTYTDALPKQINPKTGRIHTSYHQAITATGRLSSSNPNLQNIPIRSHNGKKIRATFIAAPGNILIAADYSQIELRIMAHLSKDESLVNAFKNNIDVHTHTAAEVFNCKVSEVTSEQRRHAKAINFGLIYGMSAFGLAKQLQVSRTEAQEYMDIYFKRYPKVQLYMSSSQMEATQNGYVETIFGRKLYLPNINSSNGMLRKYAERSAINAPMQGSAADLIKMAMIAVSKKLIDYPDSKIIMQVHDELVLEVPLKDHTEIMNMVVTEMQNVASLSVPLIVDAKSATNWHQAH